MILTSKLTLEQRTGTLEPYLVIKTGITDEDRVRVKCSNEILIFVNFEKVHHLKDFISMNNLPREYENSVDVHNYATGKNLYVCRNKKRYFKYIRKGALITGLNIDRSTYYICVEASPNLWIVQNVYSYPDLLRYVNKRFVDSDALKDKLKDDPRYKHNIPEDLLDLLQFEDAYPYIRLKNKNTKKIMRDYKSVWDINKQTDEICMFAVDIDIKAYKHVRNRSKRVIAFMYKKYGRKCIKYMFSVPHKPHRPEDQ